jgi:hypothetical protein
MVATTKTSVGVLIMKTAKVLFVGGTEGPVDW